MATACKKYEPGSALRAEPPPGYYAVAEVSDLPKETRRDDRLVTRGYVVVFNRQVMFFAALEPAIAFGRAARMSVDCHQYEVQPAAHQTVFCERHRGDESVLLVSPVSGGLGRNDPADELETLKRWVQGIKEHPWSSHWNGITGYITENHNGHVRRTSRRSLPL